MCTLLCAALNGLTLRWLVNTGSVAELTLINTKILYGQRFKTFVNFKAKSGADLRGRGEGGSGGVRLPQGFELLANQGVPLWFYFMSSILGRLTLKLFWRRFWRQYILILKKARAGKMHLFHHSFPKRLFDLFVLIIWLRQKTFGQLGSLLCFGSARETKLVENILHLWCSAKNYEIQYLLNIFATPLIFLVEKSFSKYFLDGFRQSFFRREIFEKNLFKFSRSHSRLHIFSELSWNLRKSHSTWKKN